jgi:hypothetical protein
VEAVEGDVLDRLVLRFVRNFEGDAIRIEAYELEAFGKEVNANG